jgi:hypothetical protein
MRSPVKATWSTECADVFGALRHQRIVDLAATQRPERPMAPLIVSLPGKAQDDGRWRANIRAGLKLT